MSVALTRSGNTAIVTIDNPPINALGAKVRQGLLEALEDTQADSDINAVVLICAGRTFIAGADIKEFGKPPEPPFLPELLAKIETASKPWIAAIHGTALGGGLETALVCRHRIASPTAKLGLPEVNLGLIPGAGGTVRLPRLIDPEHALALIAGGKPISANEALKIGLIDAVAEDDLLEAALKLAQRASQEPLAIPTSQRPAETIKNPDSFRARAAKILTKAGQQNAPKTAIALVENALTLDVQSAFKVEREAFLKLREDPQSKALRHVFFAERATTRLDRIKGIAAKPINQIGVIGGGTMGAGIAAACLLSGYTVTMIERDDNARNAGQKRVEDILSGSQNRGLISAERHDQLLASFNTDTDYHALSATDLVIEAVFENMNVKQDVFKQLDPILADEAIIATNTSYLDVNVLAGCVSHPERVIGLHFFSPAHIMKLLEIIVPDALSDQVLASAIAFAKRLGKIAVTAGVCDGFIANRIMSAYRREAEYMLEDGALPWQIDQAMTAFGFPMGIFQMQDMAGLDISWAMRKRQAASRDPNQRYVDIGDRLCEQGRFGRKSGRGYYRYDERPQGVPDSDVEALILTESKRKGIARQSFTHQDIMARILTSMNQESGKILNEGIARHPDDIDVVLINAFGFPRWRGGPMFMRQSETQPSA